MSYIIRDLQFHDRFFADKTKFRTLKEVCEQLISYHEIDCDMSVEKSLLSKGKIKECIKLLESFEWEVIKVQRGAGKV